MIVSCADRYNMLPVVHITPTIIVQTNRNHGAIFLQANRMRISCADCYNVFPCRNITLTIIIISLCHHSAVYL